MSRYTTGVRFIVESLTRDMEGENISKRITASLPHIFDFDYPIWDEDYKPILERKIIMRYFTKEIALETVGLWKLFLEERLNLIMPLYVEKYKTVQAKYDWLNDVESIEEFELDRTSDDLSSNDLKANVKNVSRETNDTTSNSQGTSLFSDFPQATLNNMDYGTNSQQNEGVLNNNANSEGENTSDTTSVNISNSKNKQNEKNKRKRTGLTGARSRTQLNIEYRQSLINIDKEIIDELYDLFMLVY